MYIPGRWAVANILSGLCPVENHCAATNSFTQNSFHSQENVEFCSVNFNTSFAVMKKTDVNGSRQPPLFRFMKKKLPGRLGLKRIGWNFTKFLVDHTGKPFKIFPFYSP